MVRIIELSSAPIIVLLITLSGCSSSDPANSDTSNSTDVPDTIDASDTTGTTDTTDTTGTTDTSGDGEVDQARLETIIDPQDQTEYLKDTQTGLTWVNDIRYCFAGITDPSSSSCAMLNDATLGGVNSWRIPTAEEMSGLILAVVADETVQLNYINASCAVMTASDGWVFTENSTSPGTISTVVPGNAGLRCVHPEP